MGKITSNGTAFGTIQGGGFRIEFENGLELSVQWKPGNYADNRHKTEQPEEGWSSESVEIAILKDGHFYTPEPIFGPDPYDEVIGYVSVDKLPLIMEQVRSLPSVSQHS